MSDTHIFDLPREIILIIISINYDANLLYTCKHFYYDEYYQHLIDIPKKLENGDMSVVNNRYDDNIMYFLNIDRYNRIYLDDEPYQRAIINMVCKLRLIRDKDEFDRFLLDLELVFSDDEEDNIVNDMENLFGLIMIKNE